MRVRSVSGTRCSLSPFAATGDMLRGAAAGHDLPARLRLRRSTVFPVHAWRQLALRPCVRTNRYMNECIVNEIMYTCRELRQVRPGRFFWSAKGQPRRLILVILDCTSQSPRRAGLRPMLGYAATGSASDSMLGRSGSGTVWYRSPVAP